MGYDITLVRTPDGEAEAVAEARQRLHAAVEIRDSHPRDADPVIIDAAQGAVDQAYEELEAARRSYFRLNIWGMQRAREAMGQRGMLCAADPVGEWPQWPPTASEDAYDWVRYPEQRTGEPPKPEDLEPVERYLREVTGYRRAHPGESPGIPVHKLGSNDGWIVTPVEIQAALAALEAARSRGVADPGEPWWSEWIDYLRRAVDHDGFEVW